MGLRPAPPPYGAVPIPPTRVGAECLAAEMLAGHDRVLSRSGTINGALLTPSYLLVLLWELSHVLWGLKEMIEPKQV